MPSRMDRYNEESHDVSSRTTKNQQLYKDLYSNKMYTDFIGLEKDNVVDLSMVQESKKNISRSDYNKGRMFYENNKNTINESENTSINSSYQRILDEDKEKLYNINDIMEYARKNREIKDAEEKKRKLKSVEYNILSDLSQEKVKEYRDRKEKGISKDEEENLEELINTITSKSLKNKIEDQLLEDLLPQDEEETLISTALLDEIEKGTANEIDDDTKEVNENTKEQIETTEELEKGLDKSFYTRSMDLKKEDLILKDEIHDEDDDYEDESHSGLKTFITVITVLLIIAVVGYIFYKYFVVK